MKKTILALAIILVLTSVVLTSCNVTGKAVNEDPVKIGVTLALTGSLAQFGESELNGMTMAVEEVNSKGGINGRELQLIVEDNKGETKEAVNNVNKLVYVDDVDMVFSSFTHITSGIKDIVNENEKILIYASTVRDFAEQDELTIRDYWDSEDHGVAMADKINEIGYRRVSYLSEISDPGIAFERGFKREAEKLGVEIVSEQKFTSDSKDLKTQILKLNVRDSDVLLVWGWKQENIIMTEMKELGLIDHPTIHFIAPFLKSSDTPEMRKLFEENDAISTWYGFAGTPNNEKQITFIKNYEKKYGENPTPDAAFAYDDIILFADAVEFCGSVDNECVAKNIINSDTEGVSGPVKFDQNGVSRKDVLFIEMKGGEWVEMK